jgi:hypothetical protein
MFWEEIDELPKNTYAASSSVFRLNIVHMCIPNSVETEND